MKRFSRTPSGSRQESEYGDVVGDVAGDRASEHRGRDEQPELRVGRHFAFSLGGDSFVAVSHTVP